MKFIIVVDGNGVVTVQKEDGSIVELLSNYWDDVTLPSFHDHCREIAGVELSR